jgi:hypothetical protein
MPAYDSAAFHPPAPLALVTVRSTVTGADVSNVPMLLDSGADVSLLPREAVADLIATVEALPQFELEAFDGTKSLAAAAELELLFLGKSFRGQFLVVDGRHGILGRNVLNAVSLLFDGPALLWRENR